MVLCDDAKDEDYSNDAKDEDYSDDDAKDEDYSDEAKDEDYSDDDAKDEDYIISYHRWWTIRSWFWLHLCRENC